MAFTRIFFARMLRPYLIALAVAILSGTLAEFSTILLAFAWTRLLSFLRSYLHSLGLDQQMHL